MQATDTKPWHQQFWPWFLILFPTAMIVICVGLFYVALRQPISMVKKNYYQEGLDINKNTNEIKLAKEMGLVAKIHLQDNHRVQIHLTAHPDFTLPPVLNLQYDHPMDDKKDWAVNLIRDAKGEYRSDELTASQLNLLNNEKHWYVYLSSDASDQSSWILQGEVKQAALHEVKLGAGPD